MRHSATRTTVIAVVSLGSAPHLAPAADGHAVVRDAIARLEPHLAELVRLVHWDGMTLVEAAQMSPVPST